MTQRNARITTMRQGLTTVLCLTSLFVGVAGRPADAQTTTLVAKTALNAVDVIDGNGQATVAVGKAPTEIAVSQDGATAYVINTGDNTVSKIDVVTAQATPFGLLNQPASLALDSARQLLFVLEAGGVVEVLDANTGKLLNSVNVGGSGGQIALSRDGSTAFVASGDVSVINTSDISNLQVNAFAPETASTVGISNVAVGVAITPDGTHAFVSFISYINDSFSFRVSGGIADVQTNLVGTDVNPVIATVNLFSQPGSVTFSPDGRRAYVAIESYWADTLYGAGFLPGRWVATIDNSAELPALATWIDLGAGGATALTPSGLGMAPDRSALFVSIPKTDTVLVIDPTTDTLTETSIAVDGSPNGVAVVPNPAATPRPFALHAADDIVADAVPAQHAAIALENVLANDTFGGGPATISNVTLSVATPTSPGLTLDASTGAVWVTSDAAVGSHTLTYQICDAASPDVCATAAVSVSVRPRFVITAADDRATALPGGIGLTNVVANDTLGPDAASLASVSVIALSSDGALALNTADGSVGVSATAARGDHLLTYRICERADPTNCSANGTAIVTVVWRDINAAGDSASFSTAGGTAIANVLANDTFDGAAATLARVAIVNVSSPNAGVTLDAATGAVTVAAGTALGPQTLAYRICERANPANCSADASIAISVTGFVINAVPDSVKASSKVATFGVINVLANDSLGNDPATTANVSVSLVSLTPSNRQVRLNANGTVDILAKSSGGTYSLRYQICELANPTNCAQATLSLNLSGGGK